MHDKFLLSEAPGQRSVVFGSFNWSEPSRRFNREIGVISREPALWEAFRARWEELAAHAEGMEAPRGRRSAGISVDGGRWPERHCRPGGHRLRSDPKALSVWIDATQPACELRVFGMTLLERLLRTLLQNGGELREVRVELPAGAPPPAGLPADLLSALPLRWSNPAAGLAQRFRQALADAQEPLLAVSADTVVDARLLLHFQSATGSLAFVGGGAESRGALLRLENELPRLSERDRDLVALAERALATGAARAFQASEFDGYNANLRRSLDPYVLRIRDAASRNRVERFLFESNYKGSTDFMTKYVYPPLVWLSVRPLARWRVHPNWVTAVSIAATFAAVPAFAAGNWLLGLTLAYGMSLLDSVDGKLARLTFTSSRLGGVLDHGLDMVHPPLWYLAWAWALGGGQVALAAVRDGAADDRGLRRGPGDRRHLPRAHRRLDPRLHAARRPAAHLHLAAQREHRALHAGPRPGRAAARPRRRAGVLLSDRGLAGGLLPVARGASRALLERPPAPAERPRKAAGPAFR